MAENDLIKRLIARRHPEHKASCKEWQFLRQSIEGGPAYVDGNLFKHPKEDPTVFEERKKRAADHHYNLTGQVLDTYEGYLFQQEPTAAEGLPQCVTEFLEHADQDGRSAISLAKSISLWEAGYGIIWVCVDKPPIQADRPLSAAEEDQAGIKPYAYIVHPTHILDGRIERGEIQWLLVQEDERDDKDPLTSSGDIVTRYRLWTKTEWTLITPQKGDGGQETFQVETQAHTLKRVPFVAFRYGEGNDFASPGLVSDIAHLDRGIFNKCSLLDEIHYAVTFPQLAIPFEGELYNDSGLTPEGNAILTMGLHSVIPYSVGRDGGLGKPDYVTPPSGPSQDLSASISQMSVLALSLALLDGEFSPPQSGENGKASAAASGVSKAYTFEKLNKRLAAIAKTLEEGFRKIFELVCLWQGEDPAKLPPVPWDFPETFEVRSLAQEIEDLAAILATSPPSAVLKAELWKRIARKALPKAEAEILEEIEEEIDASSEASVIGAGRMLNDAPGPERSGAQPGDRNQQRGAGPNGGQDTGAPAGGLQPGA